MQNTLVACLTSFMDIVFPVLHYKRHSPKFNLHVTAYYALCFTLNTDSLILEILYTAISLFAAIERLFD